MKSKKTISASGLASLVFSLFVGLIPLQNAKGTPLTNANFQDAVNLWFDAEANATTQYGHIRDWNVS